MLTQLRPALVLMVLFTALLGFVYPYATTGLARTLFASQANGSLVEKNGQVVGSSLIGQSFTSDRYFHSRPSATTDTDPNDSTKTVPSPYNAAGSVGSNYGATSKSLIDRVTADSAKAQVDNPDQQIPVDLVTASASGLDPHISPAAAAFQVQRIAKIRGISEDKLRELIAQNTEGRFAGLFGEPAVNVLQLNLALDAAAPMAAPVSAAPTTAAPAPTAASTAAPAPAATP